MASKVPQWIWSILLITSDLKWCIHLSRSLYLYLTWKSHMPRTEQSSMSLKTTIRCFVRKTALSVIVWRIAWILFISSIYLSTLDLSMSIYKTPQWKRLQWGCATHKITLSRLFNLRSYLFDLFWCIDKCMSSYANGINVNTKTFHVLLMFCACKYYF